MDIQKLNQIDPLKKQPERGVAGNEMNPLDPPDAYAPPALHRIPPEAMHPFLRQFVEEHQAFMAELQKFDEALLEIQKTGYTREQDAKLRHFFDFFEKEFIPHDRREEAVLFPLLHKRLIVDGEHSTDEVPKTAVDIMEEDHSKAAQLAAVVLNFLGLAFRLPDEKSRVIVLDAALEQAKTLVELMRLHIFREDNIVFSSAHRLITEAEFDRMQTKRTI